MTQKKKKEPWCKFSGHNAAWNDKPVKAPEGNHIRKWSSSDIHHWVRLFGWMRRKRKKKQNMFIGCFFWPASLKHMVRCQRGMMEFHQRATFIRTAVAESLWDPWSWVSWVGAPLALRCKRHIPGIRMAISGESCTITCSLSFWWKHLCRTL